MGFLFQEPAGREARPGWEAVPADIVSKIEKLLRQKILHAEIVWGGYSPSACFAAVLESQKRVFIKGAHPGQDSHSTRQLRQEIDVYEKLPGIETFSPAYLGCVGDGREDGWMLAVFDHVDTVPTLPWTLEKIKTVFELLARLHAGHAPALPPAHEKNYVEKYLRPEGGWFRIRDDRAVAGKFITLFEEEKQARDWLAAALQKLCALQGSAAAIGGPVGILHQDLRSDNILFDKTGRAYLVDWPNACTGPVVLDIACLLSSINAEDPPAGKGLLDLYTAISGLKIERENLAVALASLSGHLADNAYRAAPLKLPRLRWLQKNLLWAMLQWLATLTDIPPPPRFRGLLA
jgi:Ser/Thr protein kinase RdoA (MazF antagonist)